MALHLLALEGMATSTRATTLVRDCMTAAPETIRAGCTLAEAHRLMRELGVRHLPVLDGGKLVGVISQRDLYLIETLKGVDPEQVRVEEAMTQDPWTTAPETPLAQVVRHMADHRLGCAVVLRGAHVAGVFTTTDAMRALIDALEPPVVARAAGTRKRS